MTALTPEQTATPIDPDLQNLLEQATQRGPMTPAELQEQLISFAYGMLSDENPLTKEDVRQLDYAKFGNLQRNLEQEAALAKLDAGTHVLVPQQAIDWLNGSGPDANGFWFNHHQAIAEIEASRKDRKAPAFWWRSVFRAMITAAQEGK